jgi:hypothetical protein
MRGIRRLLTSNCTCKKVDKDIYIYIYEIYTFVSVNIIFLPTSQTSKDLTGTAHYQFTLLIFAIKIPNYLRSLAKQGKFTISPKELLKFG